MRLKLILADFCSHLRYFFSCLDSKNTLWATLVLYVSNFYGHWTIQVAFGLFGSRNSVGNAESRENIHFYIYKSRKNQNLVSVNKAPFSVDDKQRFALLN